MMDGREGEVSRPARRMRLAALVAVVAALCCAAPASAQVSGGDSPAGNTGILEPTGDPSVSGTQRVGQTLTGSDNLAGAVSVQRGWLRCNNANGTGCSLVGGATSNTYALTNADADKVIKFRALGTNLTGTREADAVTGVIDAISPANGTPPSFTGIARSGQTLLGHQGSWTGTPTIGFAYRWQRCAPGCADIPGGAAGGINYVLTAADVGKTVRLRVVATRAQNAADTTTAFSTQSASVADVSSGGPGGGGPAGGSPGAGPGTPTTPGGTIILRKLSPFPVVAIGGRVIGRRVLVSLLRVSRAPRGSIVTVTCRGRSCPFKRARRTKGRKALRIRGLERRLRSGTVITIIVRKGNTIGKYTRLRIRRGAPPARIDRCIRPGARRPSACP